MNRRPRPVESEIVEVETEVVEVQPEIEVLTAASRERSTRECGACLRSRLLLFHPWCCFW